MSVASVFEKEKILSEIKDIEQPVMLGFPYKRQLLFSAVAFLMILCAGLIFFKKRKLFIEKLRQGEPKDQRLYRQVMQLLSSTEKKGSISQDNFTQAADLTKEYLCEIFLYGRSSLTTYEFLKRASESEKLSADEKVFIEDFLNMSDRIKFAAFKPGRESLKQYAGQLQDLLKRLIPRAEE